MVAVTGASGKTGSAVTGLLLERGMKVRVIGRSSERLKQFRDKGAEIAVGDQGNAAFLTRSFTNADSVYLLIPPRVDSPDILAYYNLMGDTAVVAIRDSGIKRVVFLSSLGAELDRGTGPVKGLHDVEQKLHRISGVDIIILRPGYFMENTLGSIPIIKQKGINGGSISADRKIALIATRDIAEAAAILLGEGSSNAVRIRELFGDALTFAEMTRLIGEAVGMPDLPYVQFSEEEAIGAFMQIGFSKSVADSFVEMGRSLDDGRIRPAGIDLQHPNTPTRFAQFASEIFKPAFESSL